MREEFGRQLRLLRQEMRELAALCQQAIALAAKALVTGEEELARQAAELEGRVESRQREIEQLCMRLLLLQQPVAGDLHLVSAALKSSGDLKRIGNQTADLAEILLLGNLKAVTDLPILGEMAWEVSSMVEESVRAFTEENMRLAEAVVERDNTVDRLFDEVKGEVISLVRESGEQGERAVDLLMAAKYFERIGDHAENIARGVLGRSSL